VSVGRVVSDARKVRDSRDDCETDIVGAAERLADILGMRCEALGDVVTVAEKDIEGLAIEEVDVSIETEANELGTGVVEPLTDDERENDAEAVELPVPEQEP
jgi:hypothetical protein